MPSPSTSLATLRPDLGGSFEEFDLAMDRQGFVGHRVLTVLESMKASGPFGKIPIEQLLQNPDTLRAPGSGYSRGKFTFTTDSFATVEHGHEEPVDDSESAMYRDFFDAELIGAQRAIDAVLRNAEKRIASAVFDATVWTGSALTTAVSIAWSAAATAKPIDDVEAAVQKVYSGSGLWPNALIINRKVFRNLRNVLQIVDRIKYQGFVDVRPGQITEAAMSQVFDLNVIVAGGSKNTATEGQAAALSPIWSDANAMVAKIAITADIREPAIGRTIHWAEDGSSIGGTVESYRDEAVRSDIIRVRHQVDEKILYPQAGHLLSNIT
ncbi:MAG: hypothetical protein ACE5EX_00145 [Phycisphaerae bacterium]